MQLLGQVGCERSGRLRLTPNQPYDQSRSDTGRNRNPVGQFKAKPETQEYDQADASAKEAECQKNPPNAFHGGGLIVDQTSIPISFNRVCTSNKSRQARLLS